MNQVGFAIMMLYVALLLGTFLKILPYGLPKKLSLTLSFMTPFILIKTHTSRSKSLFQEKQYRKALNHLMFIIIGYPFGVRMVAEIATEITARKIAMGRIKARAQEENEAESVESAIKREDNFFNTFISINAIVLKVGNGLKENKFKYRMH
jgi:hypothetical protein